MASPIPCRHLHCNMGGRKCDQAGREQTVWPADTDDSSSVEISGTKRKIDVRNNIHMRSFGSDPLFSGRFEHYEKRSIDEVIRYIY